MTVESQSLLQALKQLQNVIIVTFPSGLNSKVSGERLETVSFNPILGECLQDRIPSLLRSNFVLTC